MYVEQRGSRSHVTFFFLCVSNIDRCHVEKKRQRHALLISLQSLHVCSPLVAAQADDNTPFSSIYCLASPHPFPFIRLHHCQNDLFLYCGTCTGAYRELDGGAVQDAGSPPKPGSLSPAGGCHFSVIVQTHFFATIDYGSECLQ